LIDGGEGVNPAVLREVVVIEADAGAEDGVLRSAGSIGETEARCDGFAIVVRNAADERDAECVERGEGGILRLVAARSDEEAKGSVVAEACVDREGGRDVPRVFGVEAEATERLCKGAIAGGSVGASCIWKSGGGAIVVGGELRGISQIERGIFGELDEMFSGGSESAAKNRFVDEIYAEAKDVPAGSVRDIVAELIFLLIACDGESSDDGGELIVAEGFESGSGVKICAERKGEGESEIGVAILDVMEIAGFESERARPSG